ncbi:MAG: bifunctional demethylmenaquinone methyltransferase/2-methoxy-6-polyprenyl-1,4-benzoquinol methylase UbiE [Muribaculaceae bacterium]|nr:bifunctional demethylmenaquinone methyltransferase/2-methoxy-6-polyprenyl-1,4-benzoquinol methylase UbiE [Muribaculaceae bacterium]
MSEEQESAPSKTGAERINPYDEARAKGEQVEQMFDSIAPAYDFMNSAMSFGRHRRWRDRALEMAAASLRHSPRHGSPARILDVATGTGDVAFRIHELWPEARITGIDLSEGMLEVGRRKLARMDDSAIGKITFMQADCLALPMADDTFDLLTVAYGVRNFEHLEAGLREMTRVVRPGGTVCIIELSRPRNPLLLAGYTLYTRLFVPAVGRMVSGDSRAYSYLPESIAAAPQREALTALMTRAGLTDCTYTTMTLGAVCIYIGRKPR